MVSIYIMIEHILPKLGKHVWTQMNYILLTFKIVESNQCSHAF